MAAGNGAGVRLGNEARENRSYHGAQIHDHGEWEARKIIAQRLVDAGLRSLDLEGLAKGIRGRCR